MRSVVAESLLEALALWINVKGSVITIYALHCQRDTLEKIAERKVHVVVQVKNNQPKLREAVVEQFQAVFDAGKGFVA